MAAGIRYEREHIVLAEAENRYRRLQPSDIEFIWQISMPLREMKKIATPPVAVSRGVANSATGLSLWKKKEERRDLADLMRLVIN